MRIKQNYKLHLLISVLMLIFFFVVYQGHKINNNYKENFSKIYDKAFFNIIKSVDTYINKEISKGSMLEDVRDAEFFIKDFNNIEKSISNIEIFQQKGGLVLFSTDNKRVGKRVSTILTQENHDSKRQGFVKKGEKYNFYGKPIYNATNEKVGAILIKVDNKDKNMRFDNVRKEILIYYFILFIVSVLVFSFVAFVFFTKKQQDEKIFDKQSSLLENLSEILSCLKDYKSKRFKNLITKILTLLLFVCFVYYALLSQNNMRKKVSSYFYPIIEMKANITSAVINKALSQAILYNLNLENLNKVEEYIKDIRKENKEISYVLITDEKGRVLFENGDAKKAFITDEKTGKVKLSKDFYNIALSIKRPGKRASGWLNVGMKKDFLRGAKNEK